MSTLRQQLKISDNRLKEINELLTDPANESISRILEIVEKYGGPQEINRKAAAARKFESLMSRLKDENSAYVADIDWLIDQRDKGAFVSMADYYERILGDREAGTKLNRNNAVTLGINSLFSMAWRASAMSHGKNCKALISNVTALFRLSLVPASRSPNILS